MKHMYWNHERPSSRITNSEADIDLVLGAKIFEDIIKLQISGKSIYDIQDENRLASVIRNVRI